MQHIEVDLIERQEMLTKGILADFKKSPILDPRILVMMGRILDVGVFASSETRVGLNRWTLRTQPNRCIISIFELVLSQLNGRGVNEFVYGITYGKKSFGERIVPTYELQGISRIEFDLKDQTFVRFIQEDDIHKATLVANRWGGVAMRSQLK